jgi:hypothetical protein
MAEINNAAAVQIMTDLPKPQTMLINAAELNKTSAANPVNVYFCSDNSYSLTQAIEKMRITTAKTELIG